MIKSIRLAAVCGAILLGIGAGCGATDEAAVAEELTAIEANDIDSEQLALAEGEEAPAERAGPRRAAPDLMRLARALGLSEEQVAKIREIVMATREALRELREKVQAGELSREEAVQQARALRAAQKEQILEVLTPEQRAKLEELRENRGRPFHLSRLVAYLGLSDAQIADIKAIMADTRAKVQEVRSQVEAGALSPEEGRAEVQALLKAEVAAIKAVLTPEQLAKLERILRHLPRHPGR